MEDMPNVLAFPDVAAPVTEMTPKEREARILSFAQQIEDDEIAQAAYAEKGDKSINESQYRWDFDGLDYSFERPIVEVSDEQIDRVIERIAAAESADDTGVAVQDLAFPVAFVVLDIFDEDGEDSDGYAGVVKADSVPDGQYIYVGDVNLDGAVLVGRRKADDESWAAYNKLKRGWAVQVHDHMTALQDMFEDYDVMPLPAHMVR